MCHGKEGDGKGETERAMKLNIVGFTDPATLKDRTDGELYYIIKTEEGWDLANYVHSFSRKRTDTNQKPQ